jgi:tRNA A58 N-methylase Trm61
MMTQARSWFKDHLAAFLGAQLLTIGAGAAAMLAYAVKLETRVYTMEHRGAEYTVARIEAMKQQISVLEQRIATNDDTIKRIVDVMTRQLGQKDIKP